MGTVYRAEDPFIHRTVAVKVLHVSKSLTPDQALISRERFRREAQAAASIDHPNVIRIYDFGEEAESGDMYIVMEYVPGPSLETSLTDSELPLERAVQIIGQLAAGLDAAHAQGIIHRDIKPSNILLTRDGTTKLADFGITHIASSRLTQDMRALGTPAYTSPEQVNGKTLDSRADLFSLGVLSYEILAGRKPFDGNDAVSIAYAIVHAQHVPISVANPRLPKSLDVVFERILAKEPGDRFATGREFHEALASCVADGGTALRPAFAQGSTPRRNRLYVALAGVALLSIAAIGLSSSRDAKPDPTQSKPVAVHDANPDPSPAKPVAARPARKPAPARPVVPPSSVTISLSHRIRGGTLVVTLDGAPVFTEKFSKAKLAISQTTSWDPFRAPSGKHKLKATVKAENGKTYVSDLHTVELPRAKSTEFRIAFKGDTLTVTQTL